MRARIEAAQKRRSRRRSRCICAWSTLLTGLVVAAILLRGNPRPIISISRAAHLQGSSEIHLTSAGGSGGGISTGTGTAATDAVAAAAAKAVAEAKQQQQQSAKSDVGAVAGSDAKQLFYNEKGEVMGEIVDEPIPADCHPEEHADFGGIGLTWGLDYKVKSAAQCCAACKDEASKGCNVWVWCGDPSGICWTPDVWNHTTGACWLKKQEKWDGSTDLENTNLEVNALGDFSAEFRKEHKSAPLSVPWIAGLVKPTG